MVCQIYRNVFIGIMKSEFFSWKYYCICVNWDICNGTVKLCTLLACYVTFYASLINGMVSPGAVLSLKYSSGEVVSYDDVI